ncbi:MAG TPA: (2Fe-2S) ferredoxin domain-containing protein [Candidatus Hydrogenedentes bacterium]|nr:(2Fe-2S) ferredoxin domain-containing protein [Candidatus Hydrogenedentota bacterium]
MNKANVPYKRIAFMCTNQKEPGKTCCACRGSVELQAKLKEMATVRGLSGQLRVSKSGCQGRCADGPNIMVFPDNTWYSGVQESDLETILNDLAQDMSPSE